MILTNRSERMLMYEKTKSKLREFFVDEVDFPEFPLNSADLIYTTIYVLSIFCEKEFLEDYDKLSELRTDDLKVIAQYFDFAVQAEEDLSYDATLLLLGAITYFTIENFGNSKVLIAKIDPAKLGSTIELAIYQILEILLFDSSRTTFDSDSMYGPIVLSIRNHFMYGSDFQQIFDNYKNLRTKLKNSNDIFEVSFIDFVKPIITLAREYSSWIALPNKSGVEIEAWAPYLNLPNSIHLLWPAQNMIIKDGALINKNCVVPLPTGVGKTKSFELIIYKKLMIEERQNVVVIAPLRALCNEISFNLNTIFNTFSGVKVTEFTEIYQDDTTFDNSKKNIIIATPEKFNFILRHQPQFINYIDLFIFDEAHLFDDQSRGVNYELLVAEVNRLSSADSQKILFSAILSNSNQISEWLFGENRVVDSVDKIETSEKSIGYFSSNNQIHFYDNNLVNEESFFVPNIIQAQDFNINNNNFNKWKYPRNDSPTNKRVDLCIYFVNKLVENGSVATFVGKPASINTIMKRMTELNTRHNIMQQTLEQTNQIEVQKFRNLFRLHYNDNHVYTQVSSFGVLPHYAALSEGIRESVEHAIKNNHYKAVISTSTLAEGVNIPIKYLLIHSLSQGGGTIQNRKIANLIGRTARSGVYTEGSIVLMDETIFDNRNRNYRGKMLWRDNRIAFANKMIEECRSRILILVESFTPDFGGHILPSYSVTAWINAYYLKESNWKSLVLDKFSEFSSESSERAKQVTEDYANNIFRVIDDLENYLSFIYVEKRNEIDFEELVKGIFENTFAVYLADESQEKLLKHIFKSISIKVQNMIDEDNKFFYSKSLYGLDVSERIFERVRGLEDELAQMNLDEIIMIVIEWYYQLFEVTLDLDLSNYLIAVNAWISGKSVLDIQIMLDENQFQKVEKILKNCISYDFSFFIGALLDAVSEENSVLIEKLTKIQKMIKYGVSSAFSIEFCEKIANDRMLANLIDDLLGNQKNKSVSFYSVIKNYSDKIFLELKSYPDYYTQKLSQYLNSAPN